MQNKKAAWRAAFLFFRGFIKEIRYGERKSPI